MEIERLLASNAALGVVLTGLLLVLGRANRVFLRDVARDPDRMWRLIPRLALATATVFIAWTSSLDNWRQLVGIPYRMTQRFPSQRIEYDPPSDQVRTVSLILLAISLVFVACLVARHVGGYGTQTVLFLAGIVFWLPLFIFRQRFNINLGLGFDGEITSPLDVIGYVLWVLGAWLIEIAIILSTYVVLLALVALPVTLLLDLTRLRQPKTTQEATAFFASFHERTHSPSAGGPH
ncbi:MAG: hypothetical protein ACRDJH_21085 [Thermomicrobiales bacterium]